MELLLATTNAGKFAEIEAYFKHLPLRILSLQSLKSYPTVIEDGATFEDNALKKARTIAAFSGMLTLADDSGLEVDALDGAPGIYSARYCGQEGNDAQNNKKLLHELRHVSDEKRTARFVCALALCDPHGGEMKCWTVRAACEGRIAFDLKGANGFGYDPLFYYPPFGKTFGEIHRETKTTVSHRGKALRQLAEMLHKVVDLRAKP